jgi:predicted component of type VI protein secretion system
MAQLIFHPESAKTWAYTLKEGNNTIGRTDDNDVRIGEGGVSGHHCTVSLNQGVVTITDLNSTNGTLLNGIRITQASWAPGQTLHLGEIAVCLEGADLAKAAIPTAIPMATFVSSPATAIPSAPAVEPPQPVAKSPMRLRIHTRS